MMMPQNWNIESLSLNVFLSEYNYFIELIMQFDIIKR